MEQLGVADLAQGLAEARQLWQDWVEVDPRLASAPAVDVLQDWLMLVGIDAADEVLHALVKIGSPSGKDCRPAAWVVAWALLPGAIAVARRAPAGPETDALVASQLWLEIRQFPWWRHQKVAGNVLANIRSAIAREGALKRPSWAERRTVPTDRLPEQQLHEQVSSREKLSDVLSWGEQVGLIGSGDRLLLFSLVEQTDRLGVRTVCRSGQGLMSASALARTAAEFDLAVEVLGHLAELHMTATLSSSATRCSIVNLGLKAARTMLTRCFRPSTPCVCAETRDSKLCRNVVERRDAQRQVDDALPWIVASGPPITTPGGHCGYLGGEVSGADEIVAAVRERVERRVDVVKVMASGGMATTGSDVFVPQFLIEELRLLVEQAHAAGLPVTAHAHSAAAVDQGVAAGVEGIEHASLRATEEQLGALAASGIAVCPTLGGFNTKSLAALLAVAPRFQQIFADAGRTPESYLEIRMSALRRMTTFGVRLISGDDAGIGPDKAHGRYAEAVIELEQVTDTMPALVAASSDAAAAIGLGRSKGRLLRGYDADLLVVGGDLAADLTALRDVRQVVLRGVPVSPQSGQS